MVKKIIALIILPVSLILIYFYLDRSINKTKDTTEKILEDNDVYNSNIINNVNYSSKDLNVINTLLMQMKVK